VPIPLESTVPSRDRRPRIVSIEAAPGALDAFDSECAIAPRGTTAPVPGRDDAGRARTLRLRVPKWMGAGGLAILGGAFAGMLIAVLFQPPVAAAPTAGAVTITSEPPGLALSVDGSPRGVTPLATMLVAGSHRIEVGSGDRVRLHHLQVRAGMDASLHVEFPETPAQTTAAAPAAASTLAAVTSPAPPDRPVTATPAQAPAVAERPTVTQPRTKALPASPPPRPVPAGALAIESPFPVRVLVDGQEIGTSTSPRLPVPAGVHTVTLVNERLEFEQAQELTVTPRRTEKLVVDPPRGTLHVNAQPWAQVLVDGRRAGETPIGNLSLPIGEHEVVLRHPELGEERRTVTVGARTPVRLGVEMPQ